MSIEGERLRSRIEDLRLDCEPEAAAGSRLI